MYFRRGVYPWMTARGQRHFSKPFSAIATLTHSMPLYAPYTLNKPLAVTQGHCGGIKALWGDTVGERYPSLTKRTGINQLKPSVTVRTGINPLW